MTRRRQTGKKNATTFRVQQTGEGDAPCRLRHSFHRRLPLIPPGSVDNGYRSQASIWAFRQFVENPFSSRQTVIAPLHGELKY